ncbi:MAG: alpha-glucosidase [Bacteroidota bacterium]
MKTLLKVLLALILIALIVVFIQIQRNTTKPANNYLTGKVTFSINSTEAMTGNYTFAFDEAENQLEIRHRYSNNPIWKSSANISFIMAAKGEEHVEETRGSFSWKDKLVETWTDQTVESVLVDSLTLTVTGKVQSAASAIGYTLNWVTDSLDNLNFNIQFEDARINRTYLNFGGSQNEVIYGLGAQFSKFNMKGSVVPVYITEQGIGRGDQLVTSFVDLVAKSGGNWFTSYASIPFFISSNGYGLSLDNYEYTTFDFRKDNIIQIQNFSNSIRGSLYNGDGASIISDYTDNFGRMTGFPEWVDDGVILGFQGGTDIVLEKYQKAKEAGVKISGVWIQDWVGQRISSFGKQLWWNWELDEERYHDWENFKATLRADSVKVLGYINPFLVDVESRGNYNRNMFKEALEKDFLVKNEDGSPRMIRNTSFSSGIIDLSNPECREWIKGIIKEELIGAGLDGWMADYAEALPYDVQLDQSTPATYHNEYAEVWAEVNRETLHEAGVEDSIFFFSRSGYTRNPETVTCYWLGDQMVSWGKHDGIKSAVTGLVTAGISGMAINHSDIGGYTTINRFPLYHARSSELLIRWIELNAFSPVFRSHEGNDPESNVQIYNDDRALAVLAEYSKIFAALDPYRKKLITRHQETGQPMVIHPYLVEPENERFRNYTYEGFFFGNDIYVSPVVDKGVTSKMVYLPNGDWKYLWSGEFYRGNTEVKVDCPLGRIPVFVRHHSDVGILLEPYKEN